MRNQSHSGLNLALVFVNILKEFKIEHKILSITCHNASNNDTMVEEMAKMLTAFSEVNHTHYFTHIINLIAKSLLKQFDLKEKDEKDLTDDECKLVKLAGNIKEEEQIFIMESDTGDGDTADDDDIDGWVDEIEELTYAEKENLDDSVKTCLCCVSKGECNHDDIICLLDTFA